MSSAWNSCLGVSAFVKQKPFWNVRMFRSLGIVS